MWSVGWQFSNFFILYVEPLIGCWHIWSIIQYYILQNFSFTQSVWVDTLLWQVSHFYFIGWTGVSEHRLPAAHDAMPTCRPCAHRRDNRWFVTQNFLKLSWNPLEGFAKTFCIFLITLQSREKYGCYSRHPPCLYGTIRMYGKGELAQVRLILEAFGEPKERKVDNLVQLIQAFSNYI